MQKYAELNIGFECMLNKFVIYLSAINLLNYVLTCKQITNMQFP